MSTEVCPIYEQSELLSMYYIGLVTSIAAYCTIVTTFGYSISRLNRDKNLTFASWFLLIYSVGGIILRIMGKTKATSYPNPIGLINATLGLSAMFAGLASVTRYVSEIEGRLQLVFAGGANGLLVVVQTFYITIHATRSFVSLIEVDGIIYSTMIAMPIYQIILTVFYGYTRYRAEPPKNVTRAYFEDRKDRALYSVLIFIAYAVFLILRSVPSLTPFALEISAICGGVALLFESAVYSTSLSNGVEMYIEAEPIKDNFFTTTMGMGEEQGLQTNE